MLPAEIEPFANHHITELKAVKDLLEDARLSMLYPQLSAKPRVEELEAAIRKISSAQEAFVRFRVCMVDETGQKKRLQDIALEHRLNCK